MTLNFRALFCGLLVGFAAAVAAQSAPDSSAEHAEAMAAVQATKTVGPADIPVRDQASLKLPPDYVYVPAPAAAKLMRVMGNTTDDRLVGVIFPADSANWFVVVKFVNEGYIKDDDAKDWNADDLMKSLKEGTEASNAERVKRGFPAVEVAGWAEKPQYDASTHRLVWSAATRVKANNDGNQGVNYNTYALGRDGYLSLNLVTDLADLPKYKAQALTLLTAMQYSEGKRYSDFHASTDKVAAYGLAALVAGAAAKKLGFLALALAFFAKFAKVIVLAGGAAVWGVAKFFGKKPAPATVATAVRASPSSTSDHTPTQPAELPQHKLPPTA